MQPIDPSCHNHLLLIEKQRECIKGLIYALCHKFRSPVATASGLLSLIDEGSLTEENTEVIQLLNNQVSDLDQCLFELIKKYEDLILVIG